MSDSDFSIASVAVIGSGGKMGAMFCSRFREAGFEVEELDQPLTEEKLRAGLAKVDIVMLAIPAATFRAVLGKMEGILRSDQILADITSVKVEPMQQMRKYHNGPVVGTHPLFGPEPKADEVRVAVTPDEGVAEHYTAAVDTLFASIGCEPFRSTAEEHDRAAAMIQGLNFVTTVSYLATLAHDDTVSPYLTPSFQRRLDAARKMIMEDAELFEGIFEANPFSQDAVRSFRSMLNVAAGGDVSVLVDRALWWWRSNETSGGVRQ